LTAGQIRRKLILITIKADHCQFGLYKLFDLSPISYFAMLSYRKYYVFRNAETVKQRASLKEKTVQCAYLVQFVLAQVVDSPVFEIDLAGIWSEQDYQMLYQDGLAASARADHNCRLALFDSQRYIVQNLIRAKSLANILKNDYAVVAAGQRDIFLLAVFHLAFFSLIKPKS